MNSIIRSNNPFVYPLVSHIAVANPKDIGTISGLTCPNISKQIMIVETVFEAAPAVAAAPTTAYNPSSILWLNLFENTFYNLIAKVIFCK